MADSTRVTGAKGQAPPPFQEQESQLTKKPVPVRPKWFVSEPYSHGEVSGTRGESKEKAQSAFMQMQIMDTGQDKPWVWWEKRGFRVRKDLKG